MSRTLQLAAIHGWTSLRLVMSQRYGLPSLSLAMFAGYLLLLSIREPVGHVATVVACFVMGCSCISLTRPELTSPTLPIPLPQSWVVTVNVLTQLLVCVAAAFGFVLFDVASAWMVAFSTSGGDWATVMAQPLPHGLQSQHLQLMALVFGASIPVGLATARAVIMQREPRNVWPNPRWQDVLPRWFGISAAIGVTLMAARFSSSLFTIRYLQAWLAVALYITASATIMYGWNALFPADGARVRVPKSAPQTLVSFFWHSHAIKWLLLAIGLGLYMVNPGKHLPSEWFVSQFRGRPLYAIFASMLPFLSVNVLTRQNVYDHQWGQSGWSALPAPRTTIQRTLLLDFFVFAVVSTVLLHTACLLSGHWTASGPELTPWLDDLNSFTRYHSWITVLVLPTWLLFNIPRRRFGLGLAAVTVAASLWGLVTTWSHAFGAEDATLAFNLHLTAMGSWVVLGVTYWAQTRSATGRLFHLDAPANHAMKGLVDIVGARAVRWAAATVLTVAILTVIFLHRAAMNTEIERMEENQITAEQTDRLIADLQRIEQLKIFKNTTRSRNAGTVLNPLIGLDDGTPAQTIAWWNDVTHKRMLNRKHVHWSTAPEDVEVGDLSLLQQLMKYDHWETGRLPKEYANHPPTGPYETHLANTPYSAYLNHFQPYPNPVPLVDLAKFRLLYGLRTNDVLPALQEVRHLARLLHSDETLIHTVMAIALLRMERRALEAAMERGQLVSTDWTVPSDDDLNAMHRVAASLAFVMSGGAPETQWQRIASLEFEPFGACGAIHDAVATAVTQPNVRLWPGELLPQLDMGLLNHTIATTNCNIPLARHDHNLLQQVRLGADSPPNEGMNRFLQQGEMIRLLSSELDDTTLLALNIPYLRANAWMEIQSRMHMGGILLYGDTPDADWNGVRKRGKSGGQ